MTEKFVSFSDFELHPDLGGNSGFNNNVDVSDIEELCSQEYISYSILESLGLSKRTTDNIYRFFIARGVYLLVTDMIAELIKKHDRGKCEFPTVATVSALIDAAEDIVGDALSLTGNVKSHTLSSSTVSWLASYIYSIILIHKLHMTPTEFPDFTTVAIFDIPTAEDGLIEDASVLDSIGCILYKVNVVLVKDEEIGLAGGLSLSYKLIKKDDLDDFTFDLKEEDSVSPEPSQLTPDQIDELINAILDNNDKDDDE